jgi:hypothetical protein
MEAQPLATVRVGSQASNRSLEQLGRLTWLGTLGVFCALCLFLFVRRLAGGFQHPLSTGGLLAVALLTGASASLLRSWADGIVLPSRVAFWRWVRLAGPSVCLLLLAISLSLSASPVAGIVGLWVILGGVEACWWFAGLRGLAVPRRVWRWRRRSPAASTCLEVPAVPDLSVRPVPPPDIADEAREEEENDEVLPLDVTQQLTRRHDSDGRDWMFGYLRGVFEPGERSQNLHVAFCPPFEGTPVLTVHQMSGPAVAIKRAQVETYGARLELKLAAKTGQTESVVVQFDAHWEPAAEVPAVDFPS